MILNSDFYKQDTLTVAENLLGKLIIREIGNQRLVGKIVETEAYAGFEDKASHAHKGKTARNTVMFGGAGNAYVYFTYGLHYLFNIVTEDTDYPSAVLIRAVEPIGGLEIIKERRKDRPYYELTSGPAKFTQAFNIDKCFNGFDLTEGKNLWLEDGESIRKSSVGTSPRIGVGYSEECAEWPWRFFIKNNKFVSK